MNRYVNIGVSCATAAILAAVAAGVSAQGQPPTTAKPAQPPTTSKPADQQRPADPPAPTGKPAPPTAKPAQPPTTSKPADQQRPADPPAPTGKPAQPATAKPAQQQQQQTMQSAGTVTDLGSVRIPRDVKAGGQALAAGTYQIRVTETPADPPAPGQTPQYERWAEFLRGGKVVGREVVTIVPANDIKQVAEVAPPRPGGARTEVLKGGDYLRLWLNRGGNHYLIHFNI